MHPIVPLTALSWIIALSVLTLARIAASTAFGPVPYPAASPRIALVALCLAVAVEAFVRILRRA